MSEADTVTAADVSGLNQAVVARAANLARLAGTGLLIVAGLGVVAGRLRYASIVDDRAVVDDDGPGDQGAQRAELVRDEQHRAAPVDEPA